MSHNLSLHPEIREDLHSVLKGKDSLSHFIVKWGIEIADEVLTEYLHKGYQYSLFEERYNISPFTAVGGLMHDIKHGSEEHYDELLRNSNIEK